MPSNENEKTLKKRIIFKEFDNKKTIIFFFLFENRKEETPYSTEN